MTGVYLVTGADGMLGRELRRAFEGREVRALGRHELDITDADAVREAMRGIGTVVNAAAFTAVDDAEEYEDDAYAVNATGAENLARAAAEVGARFVQVSTDYVFAGDASSPYAEDAPLAPLGAYGRTKAAGERLVTAVHPGAHIVRTAWLYGPGGANFVRTMLRLAGERDTVDVVDDQRGQPTSAIDLARQIALLLDRDLPAGVYHGTNAGEASWFDLARAVFAEAGHDPERVHPTDSGAFARPAPRPSYSVLGHSAWDRAGVPALRPWREALHEAMPEFVA
ncbi:dTDP-4-dehydrorhamnose reductase [Homoserinibacter sp. GY 40078]|uniref:dTDP-4-dehydrorhamnose reductase n=1 Tax=Homoserinibacter sp. GY 40078 TaxID=2603275 RepID=UPI0011CAA49C|nr:dTDP-4-dehydrorhamnose reductase [Homoserinibacter sp. GY 40078]TXK16243.1 dTDP-4-dehydrorhamnose reductase [Homoserinibacter sp. GY 40078]